MANFTDQVVMTHNRALFAWLEASGFSTERVLNICLNRRPNGGGSVEIERYVSAKDGSVAYRQTDWHDLSAAQLQEWDVIADRQGRG